MKRLLLSALLLIAPAFAAEVNFQYFPVGCTPPLSQLQDGKFCTGTAGVLVLFSSSPDVIVDSYKATVSFSLDGHAGTATASIPYTTVVDGNRVSLMPWMLADVPGVTINSISVTAVMGQMEVTKTVKLPYPAATY
jgi:hypothetical protein